MAQSKLWSGYCGRTVTAAFAALAALIAVSLTACAHAGDQRPVGMTLLFLNVGSANIVVSRFDPDGLRGPVPGALGASLTEGKQMSFMPGDSKRGVPQFVEVEWIIPNEDYLAWSKRMDSLPAQERHSQQNREDYQRLWSENPRHTRRIDLTPIVTPALIEQVRADRANTQLKLTIRFNNDQVSIEARAEKWRK